MKTTLDLPDDLLIEAKTAAVRRRTSLKAIVENALRRELRPSVAEEGFDPERFEVNELGVLVLRKDRPGAAPLTADAVKLAQDEIDAEDARHAYPPRG
jgi:hypothetical protein